MPDKRDFEKIDKLHQEKESLQQKIKVNEDKLKALEAKEKILTKKGRNKYIFGLGLRAEAYIDKPEFLTDEDLDEIFALAFGEPDIFDLIRRREKENMEQYLGMSGNKSE